LTKYGAMGSRNRKMWIRCSCVGHNPTLLF
jgi:hypothetical protein